MAQKILFVEDDSLIVKIYTTRLTADGYQVISAGNGEEGLRLAEQELPQVIVLDVMMPKMDGFEVMTKLKANEKTKNIPIIMFSNLGQEEEMKRALSMGVSEFVVKANISPMEMVDKIKKFL